MAIDVLTRTAPSWAKWAMRFWTSDLHLGHARILDLCPGRPWPDLEAMNRGLIGLWNETVGPEDEVWVIGDFGMGRIRETLSLVPLLNGRKFLVPGNHDRCSPAYPHRRDRVEDWVDLYLEAGFWGIKPPGCWEIGSVLCNVNHFPYPGPEDGQYRDRFDAFRPADNGLPLVHGHVHSAWQVNGRMVNVGVDVWGFRPIPEPALVELLQRAGQGIRPSLD